MSSPNVIDDATMPEAIDDATIQEAIDAAIQVQEAIPVDHVEERTEAGEAATETQPNGQRRARNVFPKITWQTYTNGEQIITHPFLDEPCKAELVFARCLVAEKPYLAAHGHITKAWMKCIDMVNEQVNESNEKVFNHPMTERYAKQRFTEYIGFVKAKNHESPFRSGCDDEEAPNELRELIEDMFSQVDSFQLESEKKKNEATKNKLECDALRAAALRGYVPRPPPNVEDASFILNSPVANLNTTEAASASEEPSTVSELSAGTSRSSSEKRSSQRTSTFHGILTLEAQNQARLELKIQKETNKQMKLELLEKEAEERRKEREERRVQKALEREEERKDREKQREMNSKMMEFMFSFIEKSKN